MVSGKNSLEIMYIVAFPSSTSEMLEYFYELHFSLQKFPLLDIWWQS